MGLTMISLSIILIVLLIILVVCVVSLSIYFNRRKNHNLSNPSWGLVTSVCLQIVIGILFFTDVLANLDLVIFDILWWSTVIIGFVFGFKDFKKNTIFSLIVILLSILLAGVGLISLLVGSM